MSARKSLEIEVKFAVGPDVEVPALTALAEVVSADGPDVRRLSAIYHDTADLRLTRSKRTLRRRTGGPDEGWHLKTPAAADRGRMEVQGPLGEEGAPPPADVLGPVRSLIRRDRLDPIAQVDNERHVWILRDAAGEPVAEFCDDHVTARSLLPGGEETQWREWELELDDRVAGTTRGEVLLNHAREVFLAAGAEDSESPSKLSTALGDSVDNVELPEDAPKPPAGSPARAVVDALEANRDRLVELDPAVRADEWDSVHQMRVATRELRSHLQTFRGILEGERFELVERELKTLASILGVARDAEVVAERFENLLERDEAQGLDPHIRERLAEDMREEYRRAHRHVVFALDSDRYLTLLDELDALLADPPLAVDEAEGKPRDTGVVLGEHLAKAHKSLMKKHKKAMRDWGDHDLPREEREERFHDVRKAAKKLRYSAEAAGGSGLKTGKLYKACKAMQSSLGDFQDTVTAREVLRKKAERAHRRGEDTFGYGVLYQIEYADGVEALADYEERMEGIEEAFAKLRKKL
ncbi:CYTH and CHAD domain-containing protein [Corynebacterium sp. 335C]